MVVQRLGPAKVTLRDVAERVGLSASAVSQALLDGPRIGEETKAKVRDAADELGYVTNSAARALRARRADAIALIVPNTSQHVFGHTYFMHVLTGVTVAANSRGDRITHFTPLNEPMTTASFCGLRGVWPPGLTGWTGWVSVVVPIALGMVRTIGAIRRSQPRASIVHVEVATSIRTDEPELADHARLLTELGWLPTDLLLGRVDPDHAMHAWLLRHGAREADLAWLVDHGTAPDIIGVNYYPELTPRRLTTSSDEVVQVSYDRGARGLRDALVGFHTRYGLPLAVTETSVEGDDARRAEWLTDSVDVVRQLIVDDVDVRGYTWWPMFDFVDWSWAANGANVEEFAVARPGLDGTVDVAPAPPLGDPADGKTAFLRRMGLIHLDEAANGRLERRLTPVAHLFAEVATPATEGAA